MRLVIDASVALAWFFERSTSAEVALADLVLTTLPECEAIVPVLWHAEVANALLVGERRGVASEAQVIDFTNRLSALPIATDDVLVAIRRDFVMALAREHALTAYDATYLELALRLGAPLATFDGKLAEAMRRAGGVVFGDTAERAP
jgi:predicted nucleic acid-binding protein